MERDVFTAGVSGEVSQLWDLSLPLRPECDLHEKRVGRADSMGFIHGNEQEEGRSEQREGGGRRSRRLVMWSCFEPGPGRQTDQNGNVAATFYSQVTALDNSRALNFCVLYKMGK